MVSTTTTTYRRPSPSQAAADVIPILVDDTYHIFHLTTPPNTVHHPPRLRSTWSRLRSKDLVSWSRDETAAIVPGALESDPDVSGAWTGSAVLGPDGNMNIFYTGYSLPGGGKQVIIRAAGPDRHGSAFSAAAREPITIIGGDDDDDDDDDDPSAWFEGVDFRDAFVLQAPPGAGGGAGGEHWMLVAARLRGPAAPAARRGCVARLVSRDGLGGPWRVPPGGPVLHAPGDALCPECPELFRLACAGGGAEGGAWWYLVYSRFEAPDAGTVYRVSRTPLGPFRVPRDGSRGRLDGRRWYAAKSCPMVGHEENKRVFFGWTADFNADDGKWLWGGDLCTPRVVSIADVEKGYLRIDPAPSVLEASRERGTPLAASFETDRGQSVPMVEGHSSHKLEAPGGGTSTAFASLGTRGGTQDLLVSIFFVEVAGASFGVALNTDEQGRGYRLRFTTTGSRGAWNVVLLEAMIPLDDFWADQYQLYIPRAVDGPEIVRHDGVHFDGNGLEVTLLLHGDVMECFFGGRSVSHRLVNRSRGLGPTETSSPPPNRLGIFVEDGDVEFRASISTLETS